jgi:hypothetical protein
VVVSIELRNHESSLRPCSNPYPHPLGMPFSRFNIYESQQYICEPSYATFLSYMPIEVKIILSKQVI